MNPLHGVESRDYAREGYSQEENPLHGVESAWEHYEFAVHHTTGIHYMELKVVIFEYQIDVIKC